MKIFIFILLYLGIIFQVLAGKSNIAILEAGETSKITKSFKKSRETLIRGEERNCVSFLFDFFFCCSKGYVIRNNYELLGNCDYDLESPLVKNYNIFLDALPSEILLMISFFLDPHDIINLTRSDKSLINFFDDSFWEIYIKENKYKRWKLKERAVEVAFAIHWYNLGVSNKNWNLIKKASSLGYPPALMYTHRHAKKKVSDSLPFEVYLLEGSTHSLNSISHTLYSLGY